MARKTIPYRHVLKLCVELGCSETTVIKVFRLAKPEGYDISRRIFEALVRDGYLDPIKEG